MMMQILVHQMIFILLLSICRASTAAPQMARPGCPEKCGNVTIPYPFGIGPSESCYRDKWFQIDCNEGKPFLRRTKLEVLSISTEGWLQVSSPVTFFCEGNNSSQAANLSDSPFVYSQSFNIFTAVSCNSFVSLSSANSVVGGCMSVCDQTYTYLSCDIGNNCCQSRIPPNLTVIDATLSEKTTNCNKFAFLVDKDWFEANTSSTTISDFTAAVKSMRKVPVALDWRINDGTWPFEFNEFTVDYDQYRHNVYDYVNFSTVWDPSCYIYTTAASNWSEIYCSCHSGFEGNPYLGGYSCDDIDECQDAHACFGHSKCVNEYGWYRCEDDRRKAKLIPRKAKLILAAGEGDPSCLVKPKSLVQPS